QPESEVVRLRSSNEAVESDLSRNRVTKSQCQPARKRSPRRCWLKFLDGDVSTLNPCAKDQELDRSERWSSIGTPVASRCVKAVPGNNAGLGETVAKPGSLSPQEPHAPRKEEQKEIPRR